MHDRIAPALHGGDLRAVALRYGCDANGLTDFSANVNPAGPPPEVLQAIHDLANDPNRVACYPDPSATPLRAALAARLAVDPNSIVVSNGAAAAIDAVVNAIAPRRCLVPVPAFSEYRRALGASGVEFVAHELGANWKLEADELLQCAQRSRVQMLVLTNPHNPSGRLTPKTEIAWIIERCDRLGIVVLVDEAFIDYAPHESVLPDSLRHENAIVVRSMAKFYGMAGIRVGYAVAAPTVARRIAAALPSWPIGAFEMAAATAALSAREYESAALLNNAVEREWLTEALRAIAIIVFPSAANFLLLELPLPVGAMDDLIEKCVVAHGLVVRDCRSYDGLRDRSLIRIAVRTREENANLVRALARSAY